MAYCSKCGKFLATKHRKNTTKQTERVMATENNSEK